MKHFEEKRAEQPKTRRPDARSRVQDVTHTCRVIEKLVSTLYPSFQYSFL
jgi:hypothetical protein